MIYPRLKIEGRGNFSSFLMLPERTQFRQSRSSPYDKAAKPINPHNPSGPAPPCRTLFIRNVQFDTLEKQIREKCEVYGDVKTIFDLIPKRGLVFVTFFDIRSAENAYAGLQDLEFKGRKADIHYSLPKEGDQEKNQASIDVEVVANEINDKELHDFMSPFGELRVIRPDPSGAPNKRIVTFWDSRSCQRALEEIPNMTSYIGGEMRISRGWDAGQQPDVPYNQRDKESQRAGAKKGKGGRFDGPDRRNESRYNRDRDHSQDAMTQEDLFRQSQKQRSLSLADYNQSQPVQAHQASGLLNLLSQQAGQYRNTPQYGIQMPTVPGFQNQAQLQQLMQNPAQLQQLLSLVGGIQQQNPVAFSGVPQVSSVFSGLPQGYQQPYQQQMPNYSGQNNIANYSQQTSNSSRLPSHQYDNLDPRQQNQILDPRQQEQNKGPRQQNQNLDPRQPNQNQFDNNRDPRQHRDRSPEYSPEGLSKSRSPEYSPTGIAYDPRQGFYSDVHSSNLNRGPGQESRGSPSYSPNNLNIRHNIQDNRDPRDPHQEIYSPPRDPRMENSSQHQELKTALNFEGIIKEDNNAGSQNQLQALAQILMKNKQNQ